MKAVRVVGAAMVAAAAASLILGFGSLSTGGVEDLFGLHSGRKGASPGRFPPLEGATAWLNTAPIDPSQLRGRVVLVEFWTYSCINWRRAFPYTRAWANAYAGRGLTVIGVHAPEFEFEKDIERVRREVKERGIDYPVLADNGHAVWRAFGNNYWPAVYLIDAQGRVRYSHFGEGQYERTEMVLRRLLEEAGHGPLGKTIAPVTAEGVEAPPDFANLRTPEIYLGYARSSNSSSLTGNWTVMREFAAANGGGARISQLFHARDAHLVMGSSANAGPVRFRIRIDGRAPGKDHGADVDAEGFGTVSEPRIYQLVRQRGRIGQALLEIEFLAPGVEAYSFSFG